MTTITIRQLHHTTGRWVREAVRAGEIRITERGRIVAKLVPAIAPAPIPYFSKRKLTAAFRIADRQTAGGIGLTEAISDDRDRPIE